MRTLIKIILHPLTLLFCFCSIIISGEHFGGFYLLYILLALPHGGLHAVIGLAGILLMLAGLLLNLQLLSRPILLLAGAACMALSLFRFFTQPGAAYNYPTFEGLPLYILVCFCLLLCAFILAQFAAIMQILKHKS